MSVVKRPLITEKSNEISEKLKKFGFVVNRNASKDEIKKEIEKLYRVNVVEINTMIYGGKAKTRYTKKNILNGRTRGYKKAVVTLKEGQTIDFYSNI